MEKRNNELEKDLEKERVKVLELNYKYSTKMAEKVPDTQEAKSPLPLTKTFSVADDAKGHEHEAGKPKELKVIVRYSRVD